MNPSPAYLQALAEATAHHASSKTYSGKFLRPHAPVIKQLIEEHDVRSILDYGCGKGEQYRWVSHGDEASIPGGMTIEQYWGVWVWKFDPAWPPFAREPSTTFDLTIATHVLGSIPLGDLNGWVMPGILARTHKVLYIAEKLGPVQKQVFSRASELPRWSAEVWREWAGAWSAHAQIPIVLSLRSRNTETIVERFIYQNGEGQQWNPTPRTAATPR